MFHCEYAPRNIPKSLFLLPLTLLFIVLLLPLIRNFNQSSKIYDSSSLVTSGTRRCNIFSGNWTHYPKKPYYNNETCPFILDQVDCMTNGRPDTEFLNYRWKPHECELPLFDATQFMKLVRGKSMAFVGDSLGRNQIQSLMCLINNVAHPEDITARYTSNDNKFFRWWFSPDYKFTITSLWSPFLVESIDADPKDGSFDGTMNLYLDEADKSWASKIENVDYVIISTGQWFLRPLTFYENGKVVGCQKCHNMTELNFYGYRKAFRTAFKTIRDLKGFKGLTFLVTYSPTHFENGEWNKGGSCDRTRPFTWEERRMYQYGDIVDALHRIQVEEFVAAEKEARKKGLYFGLIDISHAMTMRPDGHPNRHGHLVDKTAKVIDCVHWCVPGPVDTWNEILLYLMKIGRSKVYR